MQARCSVNILTSRHKKKLEKLSEIQVGLLKNFDERSARTLEKMILPQWMREILSFGPKHPVWENSIKFTSYGYWYFLSQLKLSRIPGEKLCELKQLQRDMLRMWNRPPLTKVLKKPESIWKTTFFWQCRLIRGGFLRKEKGDIWEETERFITGIWISDSKNLTDSLIIKIGTDLSKELPAMKKGRD